MLEFQYVARDPASNKQIKSLVKAQSEKAAAKLLIGQGLVPLKITEHDPSESFISKITQHVSTKERVVFTRQLATLINAGLPLAQSLHTVRDQTSQKKLQQVAQDIIISVEGGSSLSAAFAKHPKYFNDVYVALVAAGETSGTLDRALERIANQQEKDAEIMSKIRGAMIYPAIVAFVMIAVVVFMMVTVVPQIQKLYKDLGQALPFVTAVMVWLSNFLIHFWWLVLIALGALIYFGMQWRHTEQGRRVIDGFKLNVPIFGPMFRKLYMARFARTAETLMATGVPMLETLKISARSVNNVFVAQNITSAAEKVKGGKALSVALKDEEYITTLIPQMIGIGEQSGSIDTMLGKVATFYENELDNTIKSISTAIEPIMMVMLAGVAGTMILAILFPIYGLVGRGVVR